FLSTCQGMPEYWTNDAASAAEVVALLPPDVCKHVNIDANFRQPQQVAIAYADFDLVIATRMHAAILAMTAGTPVIGLAYEFKMDELFKQFGMCEMSLPVKSLSSAGAEQALRS